MRSHSQNGKFSSVHNSVLGCLILRLHIAVFIFVKGDIFGHFNVLNRLENNGMGGGGGVLFTKVESPYSKYKITSKGISEHSI